VVSIRRSLDGTLRSREFGTGRSHRLFPDGDATYVSGAGFTQREPVALRVRFEPPEDGRSPGLEWSENGSIRHGRRIGRERTVWFESDGARLHGRVQLPDVVGEVPGVVLVHGSGDEAGTEWLYNGDFLVAHGLAVLVYDKRGTGSSEGDFTFDFQQLARDAVAAADCLGRQPEVRDDGVGVSGYSQGGWVAPLAATKSATLDWVLVSYGLLESPAEEARWEMLQRVAEGGAGPDAMARADSLVTAGIGIVASGFRTGWERFAEWKDRTDGESWRASLDGTPIQQLARWPRWLVGWWGPRRAPKGLDWHYTTAPLLADWDIPMAWFLGLEDRSAPNAETLGKLEALEAGGAPIEVHVYPGADHGMLRFEDRDGRRSYTGYAPDYSRDEVDAALRLSG